MQTEYKYTIDDNDNIKLSLANIRKMKHIVEVEKIAMDKTVLLTKLTMGKRESDLSVRKI